MKGILKLLQPLQRKLGQIISRGVVTVINDALKMQELEVNILADEYLQGVERFQNYGFTSHPLPGAESILLSVGGHRSHTVSIVVDDRRYRLKGLQQGEVAIFTDEGDKIHIKRRGIIEVTAKTKVLVNSPLVEVPKGDVIASGISLLNHTHTGDSGGTTGKPN